MESGNEIPLVFWPFMALIIAYLGTIFYLLAHLRRAHHQVWTDMGSLSLTSFFRKQPIQAVLGQFRFIGFLLGTRYKSLNDPKVVTLVWAVRFLLIACTALWAFLMFPFLLP